MSNKKIVCVTGASGKIGKRLVEKLKKYNFEVRVLSHRTKIDDGNLCIYHGEIENKKLIDAFLTDAEYIFHFAAELNDKDRMWDINVNGTKNIVEVAKRKKIKYFCFLSSAGVVGKVNQKDVNEITKCSPQNLYEKSKFEAEKVVLSGIKNCQVIALRPTNVVDENNHGVMESLSSNSFLAKIKLFLRGRECAHVVHADDVVNAALYFVDKRYNEPKCFFVSYDEDSLNTYAGLRLLYYSLDNKKSIDEIPKYVHLPIFIPYILRKILRGTGNMGDVKYSSNSILSHGFSYKIGLNETVKKYWKKQLVTK